MNPSQPDIPLFKGAKLHCLNATTGDVIWELTGWAHPQTMAITDGTLIYWNNYEHQVYAVAKSPCAVTISASPNIKSTWKTGLRSLNKITRQCHRDCHSPWFGSAEPQQAGVTCVNFSCRRTVFQVGALGQRDFPVAGDVTLHPPAP
jgi:hypothetical protein